MWSKNTIIMWWMESHSRLWNVWCRKRHSCRLLWKAKMQRLFPSSPPLSLFFLSPPPLFLGGGGRTSRASAPLWIRQCACGLRYLSLNIQYHGKHPSLCNPDYKAKVHKCINLFTDHIKSIFQNQKGDWHVRLLYVRCHMWDRVI